LRPKVEISESATRDFNRLYDFGLSLWGERQVEAYLRRLSAACYQLADNPGVGRRRDDIGQNVRMKIHRHHIILYRCESTELLAVLRVFHGREDVDGIKI
jgi:toxin ParE1/3/4